jgi:hypothetical protein
MAAAKESMPTAEHEQTEHEHDHAEQHWLGGAERTQSRHNTRRKLRDYMQKVRDEADRYVGCFQHHEKFAAPAKQK